MRRVNHLFERIVAWDNLRMAVHKALAGKRSRGDARAFISRLDDNLERMRTGIVDGDFPLGVYHQFTIFDPKERLITAPCFAERVLHHAIMNVCEPVFERWLINRMEHGLDFLGCRVFAGRLVLNRRSRVRFRRKLKGLETAFLAGRLDEPALQRQATALVAFTRTPGVFSWAFRRGALESLPVSGLRPRTGSSGAGAGTTSPATAGRRTATGTRRTTGTTTSASAWS